MSWSPLTEVAIVVTANAVLAWTLTYLAHTTLAIGLAAAVDRPGSLAGVERVRLWRAALMLPVMTASIQFGLPPLFGLNAPSFDVSDIPWDGLANASASLPVAAMPFVLIPSAVGLFLMGRWYVRSRFRTRAAVRRDVLLHDLATQAGQPTPVLSVSDRIVVPAAIGRREICVPDMLFAAMPEDERRALLAHELGHIALRDPFWIGVCSVLVKATPLQPLNRAALRRLRDASEHAADDFAVRMTRDRCALASGLTALSSVVLHVTAGAAATGSPVVRRVERLLDERPIDTPRYSRRRWAVVAILALAGMVLAAPGVRFDGDRAAQRISWVKPSRDVSPRLMAFRNAERRMRDAFR